MASVTRGLRGGKRRPNHRAEITEGGKGILGQDRRAQGKAARAALDSSWTGCGSASARLDRGALRRGAWRAGGGGLDVLCVPTSEATRPQAERLGIPLTTLDETPQLDLTVDGADEIDDQLRMIKGGGGALLREKIVATASDRMVVIADESKMVADARHLPAAGRGGASNTTSRAGHRIASAPPRPAAGRCRARRPACSHRRSPPCGPTPSPRSSRAAVRRRRP